MALKRKKYGRRIFLQGALGVTVEVEADRVEWLDVVQRRLNTHPDLLALARDITEWYENAGNADPDHKSKGSVELWTQARRVIKKMSEPL